jgi:glucokinase
MAGEIGHMTLDPDGPICLCGKPGCLERFASGRYIAEDLRQILQDQPDGGRILREMAGVDLSRISAKMAVEAAVHGDRLAKNRLDQASWALGTAIGNCANLVSPDRFVLGGGVIGAGAYFLKRIRTQARATALPEIQIEILPASLGGDAPLWGAALLAEEETN